MPHLRPVTEDGGEAKINITPQLIREIFDEYPRVEAAYNLYVPEKVFNHIIIIVFNKDIISNCNCYHYCCYFEIKIHSYQNKNFGSNMYNQNSMIVIERSHQMVHKEMKYLINE
jgi:hypothetical protein